MTTNITVYAIAWGGKFIGQGQDGVAKLTVTDPAGHIVAGVKDAPITQGEIPKGGDGSGDTFQIMSTFRLWGTPVNTVDAYSYTFGFNPTSPIQLTFTVNVYHNNVLRATASNQQVVWPGLTLSGVNSVVVVLPGLLTNVVTPLNLYYQKPSTISANVFMMCGCKIDNEYWPGDNFDVQMVLSRTNGEVVATVPLKWSGLAIFSGEWTPTVLGDLVARVFALEATNGNTACSDPVGTTVQPLD